MMMTIGWAAIQKYFISYGDDKCLEYLHVTDASASACAPEIRFIYFFFILFSINTKQFQVSIECFDQNRRGLKLFHDS